MTLFSKADDVWSHRTRIVLAENSPSQYFVLNMLVAGGVQPAEVEMVSALFDKPRSVMEETNLSLFRLSNRVLAHLSVHENSPFPHNDIVVYGAKGRITGRGITRSRDEPVRSRAALCASSP